MTLIDRLRDAQDEPARNRSQRRAGPAVLSVEQLRAMERALAREMPGFAERDLGVPEKPVESAPVVEPLPLWSAPAGSCSARPTTPVPAAGEPLPIWVPPVFEPSEVDTCPDCGEEVAIDRIDLTTNASWLTCRACGMRWGGAIDRAAVSAASPMPALPAARARTGERGHIAAG